ncbi:MAG: hypothetical protein EAZ67_05135 [Cytophagales bacterium]|nr:MAG: hypothetical protein EAZ67_05135 [Cytophagales bacterium]
MFYISYKVKSTYEKIQLIAFAAGSKQQFTGSGHHQKGDSRKAIHEHPRYREVVEVLKSNPAVFHGEYLCYVMQSAEGESVLSVKGYYENGQKVGLWEEYGSKGHYKNGRKVGEWRYVDAERRLCQIYDHTKRKFVLKTEQKQYFYNAKWADGSAAESPTFIGGNYYYTSTCARYWSFTKEAIDAEVQGAVVARLRLDKEGKVIGYEIVKTPGYGLENCYKDVFEKVLKTDAYFDSPRMNGKPQACSVEIDLNFYVK